MTVTTPVDPTIVTTAPGAPGARRVAGLLGGHLSFYGLVWVGIGALLLAANLGANTVLDGDVDGSLWDGNASIFQYAMLAGGIMVTTGYVPAFVVHGLTRRATADGSLVALAGLVVAGAVATTLGFVIESWVFSLNDWPHVLAGTRELHIYDRPDQYGLILVELASLYGTHVLAGTVIGAGLFRFGRRLGVGAVVAGVLIAVVGEYLMGSGFVGVRLGDAAGLDPPPVGVGIGGTVALLVAGAAATRWLIRGMPIETRHAAWWR